MKPNLSHIEDIKEIRKLMEQSSKFLSLSGLSGVSAGIVTLLGAGLAFSYFKNKSINVNEHLLTIQNGYTDPVVKPLLLIAVAVLVLAILGGFYFSLKKAKKIKVPFFNPAAVRMLVNLFIPIITGGLVIFILLLQNQVYMAVPLSLIFYGLGLINAGKFSRSNIHLLGFLQILLGLFALVFTSYGLLLWVSGFGILHIVYGIYLYLKYDRSVSE